MYSFYDRPEVRRVDDLVPKSTRLLDANDETFEDECCGFLQFGLTEAGDHMQDHGGANERLILVTC